MLTFQLVWPSISSGSPPNFLHVFNGIYIYIYHSNPLYVPLCHPKFLIRPDNYLSCFLITPPWKVPILPWSQLKACFICLCDHPPHPQQTTKPSDKNYLSETYIGAIFKFHAIEVLSLKCGKWHWEINIVESGSYGVKIVESRNLRPNKLETRQ